jgi:hypothetical protein
VGGHLFVLRTETCGGQTVVDCTCLHCGVQMQSAALGFTGWGLLHDLPPEVVRQCPGARPEGGAAADAAESSAPQPGAGVASTGT